MALSFKLKLEAKKSVLEDGQHLVCLYRLSQVFIGDAWVHTTEPTFFGCRAFKSEIEADNEIRRLKDNVPYFEE